MKCLQCPTEFTANRKDKKYCCVKCKKTASYQRALLTPYGRKRHWKRWGINITFDQYNSLLKDQEKD